MYQIERSSDLAAFLRQTELWNSLASGIPFRETSWLAPWWKHYGQDQEPYVLIARDSDNQVRGILPLYVKNSVSGRTLSMIGDGDAFSDYVSILCRSDEAQPIATAMGNFLAQSTAHVDDRWDMLDIDGMVEGDVALTVLANTLMQHGASVHAQSRMHTWYRPATASWDDHVKLFSKTQRRKMRRWSEKVGTVDGLEKHAVNTIDQLDATLQSLIDLHQKRWNSIGEPGSFAAPVFREFIRECVTDFFNRDRLHLPTLTHHGQVISGELHFIGGDRRLYCFSSGYDIDREELEPGRVLNVETLNDLYRNDWTGIDFLRGDEPYKKRMSAIPTRVLRLRATAPALLPRLRHAAWKTGFEVKQWARRRTGRTPIMVVDLSNELTAAEPTGASSGE